MLGLTIMRVDSSWCAKIVILLVLILCVGGTVYLFLNTKNSQTSLEHSNNIDEHTNLDHRWTIDAKIDFYLNDEQPISIGLYLPSHDRNYAILDESFNNALYGYGYSYSVNEDFLNRSVQWNARSVKGKQTLRYRLTLADDYVNDSQNSVKGELFRSAIEIADAQKPAVQRLVREISDQSTDSLTRITNTIKAINDPLNLDARLLLNNSDTIENKVQVIELILSQFNIPLQRVHTLQLKKSTSQKLNLWIRSYIGLTNNTGRWYYFNPFNGEIGLPNDHLLWSIGNEPIITINNKNAIALTVDFIVN